MPPRRSSSLAVAGNGQALQTSSVTIETVSFALADLAWRPRTGDQVTRMHPLRVWRNYRVDRAYELILALCFATYPDLTMSIVRSLFAFPSLKR